MRYKRLLFFTFVVCCMPLATTLFAQISSGLVTVTSEMLEDFDGITAERWEVRGSRDLYPEARFRVVDAWPEVLYGYQPQENRKALGIQGGFTRKGYNFIELLPPIVEGVEPNGVRCEVPAGEDQMRRALPIRGDVQSIEMWVWASNRNYFMEAHLRDHRGLTHPVRLGSIRHVGWNKIDTRIPPSIPQVLNVNRECGLELTKLVIWTRPEERVDRFHIYIDELRALSDTFRPRIDGERLADSEFIQQAWEEESVQ